MKPPDPISHLRSQESNIKLTGFNDKALMLRPWCITETEDDVLQTRGLGCRPMNAVDTDIRSGTSYIEYQVSDLPVEDIGRIETQTSSGISGIPRLILITINQRKCREI